MKAKFEMLEIDGEKYPIAYNMIVSRELQEIFGTISEWTKIFETVARDEFGNLVEDKINGIQVFSDGEVLKNDDGSIFMAKQKEVSIKDMTTTFKLMINEGIRQFNKNAVDKMHFLDNDDVCELLGYINGADIVRDLVVKANPKATEEDSNSKNVQTEQNQ